LINLKLFSVTVGIGGVNCSHCPSWLHAWPCPTEIVYWAKTYANIFTRAAHWMAS